MIIQAVLVIASTDDRAWSTRRRSGSRWRSSWCWWSRWSPWWCTGSGGRQPHSRGVAEDSTNYFAFGGGLMAGMIVGLGTLVGFRLCGEHGRGGQGPVPQRAARDRGIGGRGGVLGLLFLIALTVAIDNIPRSRAANRPSRRSCAVSSDPVTERILLVRHRVRVLRRRGCCDGRCSRHGLRDGARRPVSRAQADAKGGPPHANSDPGNHFDPSWSESSYWLRYPVTPCWS